jgi:hypothetical protein
MKNMRHMKRSASLEVEDKFLFMDFMSFMVEGALTPPASG